jgi:protein-S-isoprenylcysteine O-methyltransferase Ste14
MDSITPLTICFYLWLAWAAYWIISAWTAQKTKLSEGMFIRLQHLVPLAVGFLLIFYFKGLIYGRFYKISALEYIGVAVTLVGLLFAVWARVHLGRYWSGIITLKEGHKLIRSGPYKFVRHPIYTGFLSAVFGSALTASTGDAYIGFAIMLVSYIVKIHREEKVLSTEFGDEYLRFKQEVPALFPFIY